MESHQKENIVAVWYNQLCNVKTKEITTIKETVGCPSIRLPLWENIDDAVVDIIVKQMLSLKAANSIIGKV